MSIASSPAAAAATAAQPRGSFRFEDGWAKLPEGWTIGDVGGVAVDDGGNVYVFNRGAHPMIVFDRAGNYLRSWGEGIFRTPHAVDLAADGFLYCTDDGDHTVRKCTPDGRVVLQFGEANRPAPFMSGRPFNRCTHTALAPDGAIFVTDGYGNGAVHKYAPDGRHLFSFGSCGSEPGQFYVPHNICCDADGFLYVADRENHRIQVFDANGRYETQWNNLVRPMALHLVKTACGNRFYVGEAGPSFGVNFPNLGPRLSILNEHGRLLTRFGDDGFGHAADRFLAPHGIAVDRDGDVYIGEVANAAWPIVFRGQDKPADLRTLRKLKWADGAA